MAMRQCVLLSGGIQCVEGGDILERANKRSATVGSMFAEMDEEDDDVFEVAT